MPDSFSMLCQIPLCMIPLCLIPVYCYARFQIQISTLCLIPLCHFLLCHFPLFCYDWFRYDRFRYAQFPFFKLCLIPLCHITLCPSPLWQVPHPRVGYNCRLTFHRLHLKTVPSLWKHQGKHDNSGASYGFKSESIVCVLGPEIFLPMDWVKLGN